MSKPASLPEWASDPSAEITEPLLSKKQIGNTVEAPKHDYFNWWMNLVWLWTVWLNAFESTVHTWTAAQTFSSGIVLPTPTVTYPGLVTGSNQTGCRKLGMWTDVYGNLHIEGKVGGLPGTHASEAIWANSTVPSAFRPATGKAIELACVCNGGTLAGMLAISDLGALSFSAIGGNITTAEVSVVISSFGALAP